MICRVLLLPILAMGPAIAPVQAQAAELPPALAELHAANDDCEAPEDLPDLETQEIMLEEGRELWLVPCYAGAYRFAYAAYRNQGEFFERLRFADYSDRGSWSVADVIVNPEWDAASATLTSYDMGRGVGDCGSRGEWRRRGHAPAGALLQQARLRWRRGTGRVPAGLRSQTVEVSVFRLLSFRPTVNA